MSAVKIELHGKKVILLNGACVDKVGATSVQLEAPDKLLEAAQRDPDAVAFGYFSGRWVAAA
jgi:hypothetical protein